MSGEADSRRVLVFDLQRRRRIGRYPTGTPTPLAQRTLEYVVGIGPTTDLLLTQAGSVAWIATSGGSDATYEVHYAAGPTDRLLAVGPDVSPRSLALNRSGVHWTQGGQPRFARF